MQQILTLRKTILILGLALVFIGCANNESLSQNDIVGFKVENVPEGIQITFEDIQPDINHVFIAFNENIEGEEPFTVLTNIEGTQLAQLKKTGMIICPFIQKGRNYDIYVAFIGENINQTNASIETENNGIHLLNEITLTLNDSQTGVTLSAEPVFSENIEYDLQKFSYMVTPFLDYSNGHNERFKDNLIDKILERFPGMILNFSLESSKFDLSNYDIQTNNFLAHIRAFCRIKYDEIIWEIKIGKSSQFSFSV